MKRCNAIQGILGILAILTGCSGVTEVSTPDLIRVVERDGIAFSDQAIPEEILVRLAQFKVVVVGETHFLREHRLLMAELIRELHHRGYRQLLFEWPQMADWLLNDYVKDGGLAPNWSPPLALGGDLLTEIRSLNRTLPSESQFEVRGIDVNLDEYGGTTDFLQLFSLFTGRLTPRGLITGFLQNDYASPKSQRDAAESLRDELVERRGELTTAWGQESYDVVREMIEVEIVSIGVRAIRDDRYDASARLRENAMKRLAEIRLTDYKHRTLVNVGSNHAQKNRLRGTDQEWLGDYLVHKSPAAEGSAIVLSVVAAQISRPGGSISDQLANSPANEIFRVMHETWPDQTVFLPLDDPIFLDDVPMIYEETVNVGSPKEHYDCFLLLPLAHQVPID